MRRIHGDPKIKGQRGYGWKKPLQTLKALPRYPEGSIIPTVLPPSVDLTPNCPPVCDQGPLGTCTAFSTGSAMWYDMIKQDLPNASELSELFIYYTSGMIEGDPTIDSGRAISDVISALTSYGAPPETDWPYDTTQFAVKPPVNAFMDGQKNLLEQSNTVAYEVIPSVMKATLFDGDPFVIGIVVYQSFESANANNTGDIPMPATDAEGNITESILGGHAIMIVGYDDVRGVFIFRNSWGADWGNKGYGTLPYAYLTNTKLASEAYCLKVVGPQ